MKQEHYCEDPNSYLLSKYFQKGKSYGEKLYAVFSYDESNKKVADYNIEVL